MPTIDEIRKQFPQYNDISNDDLEDRIHKKFYSDMPRSEFYQRLSVKGVGREISGKIPSQESGLTESALTGMQDPIVGAKQLYTHAFGDIEDVKKIDAEVRQREADIARSGVNPIARGVGSIVTTAPLMAAGAAGLPGAMAAGAVGGALEPTTQDNFTAAKLAQTGIGAATAGAGTAALRGAGAAFAPAMQRGAQALSSSGVELTPGQAVGGIVRRLEEAAKSIPILGNFVRGAEGRSVESFNKSVLNQALEPIGQSLGPQAKAGHSAIDEAYKKISGAYDTLLPNFNLTLDQPLARDIADIRINKAGLLTTDREKQFNKIINNRLGDLFRRGGPNLTGKQLKEADSQLRVEADGYRSSPDGDQRKLAAALDDVRDALHKSLLRQNPSNGDLLNNIDSSYAMWVRARGAGSRRATSEGVFTPNDLLQTIKSQDKSVGKGQFARGDALMQVYAEAGQRVLPGKMPDSGTPERLRAFDIVSAAGGSPFIPLYTQRGSRLFSQYAQPGATRQAARSVLRRASPFAGIAATPSLTDLLSSQ